MSVYSKDDVAKEESAVLIEVGRTKLGLVCRTISIDVKKRHAFNPQLPCELVIVGEDSQAGLEVFVAADETGNHSFDKIHRDRIVDAHVICCLAVGVHTDETAGTVQKRTAGVAAVNGGI